MQYQYGMVSVIIPTYKRSERLSRAIESVLNQTYSNIELLLVNDNEPTDRFTDDLKQRVKKYESDSRFHLILQEKHVNGAVARNTGIRLAKGEYIAFLDDDDWWEKNKIEEQIKALETLDDSWGGTSCKYHLVNRDGKIIGKSKKYRDGKIYFDILTLMTDVTTCSLLLRHSCLDQTGYFDENLLRHQDFQLLVNFTYKYKLMEVDRYLLNIDVSDTQNRPDGDKLLKLKKDFFFSIRHILSQLSVRQRACVFSIHKYELGYVYLKNKNIKMGLKYCASVFSSPEAMRIAIKKTVLKLSTMVVKG